MESKLHYGWRIELEAQAWYVRTYPAARLLERNFRTRRGEIDLIFEEGVQLVFVEVRARRKAAWESGFESVRAAKQMRLVRAIEIYLSRYRGRAREARLDVLSWDGSRFEHYRNLWPLAGQT